MTCCRVHQVHDSRDRPLLYCKHDAKLFDASSSQKPKDSVTALKIPSRIELTIPPPHLSSAQPTSPNNPPSKLQAPSSTPIHL